MQIRVEFVFLLTKQRNKKPIKFARLRFTVVRGYPFPDRLRVIQKSFGMPNIRMSPVFDGLAFMRFSRNVRANEN